MPDNNDAEKLQFDFVHTKTIVDLLSLGAFERFCWVLRGVALAGRYVWRLLFLSNEKNNKNKCLENVFQTVFDYSNK